MKAVGFSQQALGRLLTGALALGAVTVQANHVRSPGTWTPPCPAGLACMLEGREGFAMTQIANQLVVSHGLRQGAPLDSNDTRIYDIDTNTWFDPAPVPPLALRSELAGASHGGLHYAVGGRGICFAGPAGVCADLEVYDPVANTWSEAARELAASR